MKVGIFGTGAYGMAQITLLLELEAKQNLISTSQK